MACSAFCSAARFRCTSAISSCSFFGSFMICFTCADAGRWRSNLRERLDLPWNAGLLHYSSRRVRRKFRLDEACYTRHFLLASWKQAHVFLVLAECPRRAHLRLALGERLDRGAALQHLLHVLHALRHLLQPALHVFHRKDQIHDLSPEASGEKRTKFSSDLS